MTPSTPPPAPLTVAEFQQHIARRYEAVDRQRGPARTFLYFVEEVGELATALARLDGAPADPAVRANLEEEFADVVAWLCTLANITEVDLAAALQRKYLSGAPPKGHK